MTDRYTVRTQPSAAEVARPQPSAIGELGQLGATVISSVRRKLDEQAQVVENAALNTARRQLAEQGAALEQELQTQERVAGDGYVPDVQKRRQDLKQRVWGLVPDSVRESARAQMAWDDIWSNDEMQATDRAVKWQTDQRISYVSRSIEDGLKATEAALEADPDTAEVQLKAFRENLPGYKALLTPEQLAKVEQNGFQRIMLANVRGLARAGRFDEADALVGKVAAGLGLEERAAFERSVDQLENDVQGRNAEDLQLQVIDGKAGRKEIDAAVDGRKISQGQGNTLRLQHKAMIAQARNEVEQERNRQKAAAKAAMDAYGENIERQILKGEATEADVDLALEEGRITVAKANELTRAAREGQKSRSKAQAVLDMRELGIPLDPHDPDTRAGIDAIWEMGGGAAAFTQTTEIGGGYKVNRGTAAVLEAARDVGVIPPAAASSLQGMATNGSDEQKLVAFDTVAQMWDANRGAANAAFPDGADRVLKDALSWRMKTQAGLSPEDALRAVERENEIPANPVLQARKTEADKIAAKLDPGEVRGWYDNDWNPFAGVAEFAPGADAEAAAMIREAFRTEYIRTGDQKLALELAQASVKKVMGATTVGASRSVMPYPPENYYPPALQERAPGWLNDDLVAGVRELVDGKLIPGVEPGTEVKPSDLRIIADGQTARAVREQQPPSYVIEWKGQVLDQRWRFDDSRVRDTEIRKGRLEANTKKREAEKMRIIRQGGWSAPEGSTQLREMLGARSLAEMEQRGGNGRWRSTPGATPLASLFEQFGSIDARYAESARAIEGGK